MTEPKICSTSGRPTDVVRAEQVETEGQYKDYIVLCPDERAKGFIRPYRDKYIHIGKTTSHWKSIDRMLEDDEKYVAIMSCELPDGTWYGSYVTQEELDAWNKGERIGGCGVLTKMGQALSETYARQPSFYGATYCVGCKEHLPVGEFIWEDGETVGS